MTAEPSGINTGLAGVITEGLTALFTPTTHTYTQAEVAAIFTEADLFAADSILEGCDRVGLTLTYLRARFQVGGAK